MRAVVRFLYLLVAVMALGCSAPKPYFSQKSAISSEQMVVAAHPLAVEAGLEIFRKGGNIIDAAVAVQFALAVVNPRAGNIGGGGFLVYRPALGQPVALDFREKAPTASRADMFLDSLGNPIPQLSLDGPLSVGVPGSVAGLYEVHRQYGSLPFRDLLKPAIELARRGFPISQVEADRLQENRADFLKWNGPSFPFIQPQKPWEAGDLLIQPRLAKTLRRIARKGWEGYYQGPVARHTVKRVQESGGILTLADLESYRAVWRQPLVRTYNAYRFITMPPPSSGGLTFMQLAGFTADYPFWYRPWGDPETTHYLAEAMRRAFADRSRYAGDPDYAPIPVDSLLESDYLLNRMSDFKLDKATPSGKVSPGAFDHLPESFETTHTSLADAQGNAVSITTTLNNNYGSKVYVHRAGYFLNDQMDDFSVKPGQPNFYGLTGSRANAVGPGKRMASSMTPLIVEKDGKLFLVAGSPGGSTIPTSVFQVFLNIAHYGMPADQALQAPRMHHQWLPDELWYEADMFEKEELDALKQKGHKPVEKKSIGRVKVIHILPDGRLHGAGDPRNPDDHAGGN